jgi:hypothetical protein
MWTPATVHHAIIKSFIDHGHAPALPANAEPALHELAAQHGVVLHPGTTSIWIAHPFSASPTAVWVQARDRGWWAPCMWCALGVCALAAPTATIHARYGGESEPVAIAVDDGHVDSTAVVHFAMPPRDAWNNVVHWCATVLPFRARADIDAWTTRHALPRGDVVDIARVMELARAWYGGHAREDWRKHTTREAQGIFTRVGLVGPHWQLPDRDDRF